MHKKMKSRTLGGIHIKSNQINQFERKKDNRSKACLTIERKQKTADGWTKQVVGLTAPSS